MGGSGAICEIVNPQGHQGTRRKYLKPKAFVILRALGGSGFHPLHRETASLPDGLRLCRLCFRPIESVVCCTAVQAASGVSSSLESSECVLRNHYENS